ncbi:hypothetical protein [Streptomyces phaeochromogenes]
MENITPIRSSGTATTSLRLELAVGVYTTTLAEASSSERVDAVLGEAAEALMGRTPGTSRWAASYGRSTCSVRTARR